MKRHDGFYAGLRYIISSRPNPPKVGDIVFCPGCSISVERPKTTIQYVTCTRIDLALLPSPVGGVKVKLMLTILPRNIIEPLNSTHVCTHTPWVSQTPELAPLNEIYIYIYTRSIHIFVKWIHI